VFGNEAGAPDPNDPPPKQPKPAEEVKDNVKPFGKRPSLTIVK